MALTKEQRKLFDKLNKRYKVFKQKGVTSNAWQLIQNELLNIYMEAAEKRGMDISRINFKQNIFSLSKNIDPETLEQMLKVAEYAEKTKSTSYAYYKKDKGARDQALYKAYQTLRNKGDVDTMQDYIDFVDTMEQAKQNVGSLMNKLYERIGKRAWSVLEYGRKKGLSESRISDIIEKALASVLYGDPLLSWLLNEINAAYERNMKG